MEGRKKERKDVCYVETKGKENGWSIAERREGYESFT